MTMFIQFCCLCRLGLTIKLNLNILKVVYQHTLKSYYLGWYNFFTIQVFVRAHFDYDPEKDKMIPCQDAGLSFKNGDVLQIVEQDDPNWWQVSILSLPLKKIPVSLSDLLAKHKKMITPKLFCTFLVCIMLLVYEIIENRHKSQTTLAVFQL